MGKKGVKESKRATFKKGGEGIKSCLIMGERLVGNKNFYFERNRSASIAALHPEAAAVQACR